jgi:hypothetical protein
MIGNEGGHASVDAAISTNAGVNNLNVAFNDKAVLRASLEPKELLMSREVKSTIKSKFEDAIKKIPIRRSKRDSTAADKAPSSVNPVLSEPVQPAKPRQWQKSQPSDLAHRHQFTPGVASQHRLEQIKLKSEEAKTKYADDATFKTIMSAIDEKAIKGEFKYSNALRNRLHIAFTPPMDPGFETKLNQTWDPKERLELAEAVKAVIAAHPGSEESKKSVMNYLDKFIHNLKESIEPEKTDVKKNQPG